jgi:hypothetical protein
MLHVRSAFLQHEDHRRRLQICGGARSNGRGSDRIGFARKEDKVFKKWSRRVAKDVIFQDTRTEPNRMLGDSRTVVMSTKANLGGRLETKTSFLRDIIGDIKKGEIKIPQFQRKFVWKEEQALNLLDSISNNYPVGSVLLWRTHTKLAVERNIGDFKLPKTDDHSPTDYVLDGQQRITVVYSCLGAPPDEPGFAAGFDLDNEEFVELPVAESARVFPMRWLFSTTELLNFRTGLQTHTAAKKYQQRLDELVEAFTSYRLPVVVLKELSVGEVCPIFERINSSGTKLSMYDLMVAATWSPRFDLNELSDKIAASLEGKGFEGIEPTTILKCLSAVHFGGLKKDHLLSMRDLEEEKMNKLVAKTEGSLLRAVDLLATEFGIFSWDFLPYEALLIVICYLCSRLNQFDAKHVTRIRQWFWRSGFSERYRVGGESFVTRDLETVLQFVQSGGDPKIFGEPLTAVQLISSLFRQNNSRTRAFILALAAAHPRNLTNGALIDTTDALSHFNKKQFHHIYPRAHLRRSKAEEEGNALANICMLAAAENNLVSDADPQKYIPELILEKGLQADGILQSNVMPSATEFNYARSSYGDFLNARAAKMTDFISKLCDGTKT